MTKRIAAIIFIFVCTSLAWMILGGTISYRTYATDDELRQHVTANWGTAQQQAPPTAAYYTSTQRTITKNVDGHEETTTKNEVSRNPLPLEATQVNVGLNLNPRKKGLLWYSTYQVGFDGVYAFRNPSENAQNVSFTFQFPADQAIYDDLRVSLDDAAVPFSNHGKNLEAHGLVAPHQSVKLHVAYRSQGLNTWTYAFGDSVSQMENFTLTMSTNFGGFNFPDNSLSPTDERKTPTGWDLTWKYNNLVSGYPIGIAMPQKAQPGPLAGRISFFAPVSLFFFFFVLFIVCTIRGVELHPMNYFFLACTFFSFHLLLAYLVDHISIHLAFAICSVVSIALLVSYLRVVVGLHFAVMQAGLIQFIYLVLFSYAFFFEGFTGLAVTIGAILTLFIVMQMTAKVRWQEKFSPHPARA
jgi:inner membrane protein involved in colicin E2 resistance